MNLRRLGCSFASMAIVCLAFGGTGCEPAANPGGPKQGEGGSSVAQGGQGGQGGDAGAGGAGGGGGQANASSSSSSGSSSSSSSSSSSGMGGSGGSVACTDGETQSCFTGDPATLDIGACHGGTQTCKNGMFGLCAGQVTAKSETCNDVDDDCDGTVDNGNPGGGITCATGQQGVCAAGTMVCQGGSIVCQQNAVASAEVCDGIDNDCNGALDNGNPGGGVACSTGQLGACAQGVTACVGGAVICFQTVNPSAETCDGIDNDCNGEIDNGNPGMGMACSTGQPVPCAAGTTACMAGSLVCNPNAAGSTELCDGIDNNCNGQVDEGNPEAGMACATGQPACSAGNTDCQGGTLICAPIPNALPELCDGIDNNCNGQIDEGNPEGGMPCSTGQVGVCGPGTMMCQGAAMQCIPNASGASELCDGVDNNCNGQIDEGNPGGGVDCGPAGGGCAATTTCKNGALICAGTFVGPAGIGAPGNPGTPSQPLATISAALARAQSLGGNQNLCLCDTDAPGPSIYPEVVSMIQGISIYGGYNCADWSRDIATYVTTIQAPTVGTGGTTLVFSGNITSATSLDGVTVEGPSPGFVFSQSTSSMAIHITNASPTLVNVTARGGSASSSAGMLVQGTGMQPRVTVTGGRYEAKAHAVAGHNTTQTGISLLHASGTISNITTWGGDTFATSGVGFICTDCGATTISDSVIDAGHAYTYAYGLYASGDVTGMSITNTTIRAGTSNGFAGGATGLVFDSCIGSPTVTSSTLSGGVSTDGSVAGLAASGAQCKPIVSNSTVEGGKGVTTCSGMSCGYGALCNVSNSNITGATGVAACKSYGLSCFYGGCGTISQNTISAGSVGSTSALAMGLRVIVDNPTIDGNLILGPQCPPTMTPNSNTQLHAAYFSDTSSVVTNNILRDQPCQNGPVDVMRFHRVNFSLPITHGNTIQFATCNNCPVKRGLIVTSGSFGAPLGIVRNNIFVNAGTDGFANGYAVVEAGTGIALQWFENNDIWVPNGGTVYYADGATPLTLAALNMRAGASNNISADPLLDATFHISAASPCRNAGTATGAPAFDFDGDQRPQEMSYDIGADEYVP